MPFVDIKILSITLRIGLVFNEKNYLVWKITASFSRHFKGSLCRRSGKIMATYNICSGRRPLPDLLNRRTHTVREIFTDIIYIFVDKKI